jgi:predicted Holliday junction resolvase-like endonuclease
MQHLRVILAPQYRLEAEEKNLRKQVSQSRQLRLADITMSLIPLLVKFRLLPKEHKTIAVITEGASMLL